MRGGSNSDMQADKVATWTRLLSTPNFSAQIMPPVIEDDGHDGVPNSPFPIEYEDSIDDSTINHEPTNNASPNDSQPTSTQPMDAAPTFLARLSQLPMRRSLPWREGHELPPERSTQSSRVQQRGACLLATRGDVNVKPCDHCLSGHGRFAHCITLGNWFQGACSSCIFTSKGNRCSFRVARGMCPDLRTNSKLMVATGNVDGRTARYRHVEEGGMVEERKPRKRKRRAFASSSTIVKPTSTTLNQNPAQRPAAAEASPHMVSPDLDSSLQAATPREEPIGLLGHVHKEKKQKRRRHTDHAFEMHHDEVPRCSSFSYERPGQSSSLRQERIPSSPLTAGPQPSHNVFCEQPTVKRRESGASQVDGGQAVPLIDTFAKPKQRQIFGLISGIQGGIDHLQKQLDLLQRSLGLESEKKDQTAF